MPQTLMALLALAFASLLTFSQQTLTLRAHQNTVADELELAAAGVASEALAFIDGRSFDEESTPEAIGAEGDIPDGPADFSAAGSFGGAACDLLEPANTPACDDVDDVASPAWRPVEIEVVRRLVTDAATGEESVEVVAFPFEVRTSVYYVADPESMDPAPGPTRHKRVLLDVRTPYVPTAEDGIYRATRVISYDPVKAEMDWENSEYYDPAFGEGGGGTTSETAG